MSKIKNKHHYVFQAYLKNWGDDKEKIWVCNKKEKRTFYTRTDDVLNKRRLYENQDLNDDEKAFFELIMTALKLNNADKSEMRDHIDAYLLPFENRKLVDLLKKKMSVSNSRSQNDEIKEGFEKIDLWHGVFEFGISLVPPCIGLIHAGPRTIKHRVAILLGGD